MQWINSMTILEQSESEREREVEKNETLQRICYEKRQSDMRDKFISLLWNVQKIDIDKQDFVYIFLKWIEIKETRFF